MRVRPEILLNALIALVVGANILVLFLIYEDRTSGSAESVDTPTALVTSTVASATTEGSDRAGNERLMPNRAAWSR